MFGDLAVSFRFIPFERFPGLIFVLLSDLAVFTGKAAPDFAKAIWQPISPPVILLIPAALLRGLATLPLFLLALFDLVKLVYYLLSLPVLLASRSTDRFCSFSVQRAFTSALVSSTLGSVRDCPVCR